MRHLRKTIPQRISVILSLSPIITRSRFLGYRSDDDTSLVECRPHTGRTHQLRLHLQLLGNPIANDPCYGGRIHLPDLIIGVPGTLFYGQHQRREEAAKIAKRLLEIKEKSGGRLVSNMPHLAGLVSNTRPSEIEATTTDDNNSLLTIQESSPRLEGESEESYLIRNCRYCKQGDLGVSAEEVSLVHCDSIWLHAKRYQGSNWMFETPAPDWGNQDDFPDKIMGCSTTATGISPPVI